MFYQIFIPVFPYFWDMRHPDLYVQMINGKGRGIFSRSSLRSDLIIEIAPVIVMTDAERKLLDQTLLHDYLFEWTPDGTNMCCMALGYVPVYNHSYESNCEYFMNYEEQTILIKTMQPITAGAELTINYNGDWNNRSPVWFDVK